jgi:hypothetical protein
VANVFNDDHEEWPEFFVSEVYTVDPYDDDVHSLFMWSSHIEYDDAKYRNSRRGIDTGTFLIQLI